MSDLPALPPGPTEPQPIEPTTVQPAPQAAATPEPPTPITVLTGVRTITAEPPAAAEPPAPAAPKPPRRSFAERARTRKLRHGRRRAQRAATRAAEPEQYDEPIEDDTPDEPDAAPGPPRWRVHRRQRHTGWTPSELRRGRLKTLLVTGAGAGIGWQLGLGPLLTGVIRQVGVGSTGWAVGVGATAVGASAYLDFVLRGGRTPDGAIPVRAVRSWGLVFAVIARIPLGTALLVLCLYTPGRMI